MKNNHVLYSRSLMLKVVFQHNYKNHIVSLLSTGEIVPIKAIQHKTIWVNWPFTGHNILEIDETCTLSNKPILDSSSHLQVPGPPLTQPFIPFPHRKYTYINVQSPHLSQWVTLSHNMSHYFSLLLLLIFSMLTVTHQNTKAHSVCNNL